MGVLEAFAEDVGDVGGGEVEVACGVDDGPFGDAGNHVRGGAQLADGQRQAYLEHPLAESLQAFFCQLEVGFAVGRDVPYIFGEADELGQSFFHGAAVVGERDGGEAVAVGCVGPGTDGMPYHVYHPVFVFAAADEGVECPGGGPHDVGASLVVLWVFDGCACGDDEASHEPFGEVVAGVVVEVGEVLLHDVAHDVEDASFHLFVGDGKSEVGVEDGEARHEAVVEDVTDLEGVVGVGDDGAGIHFGASAGHGEDASDGRYLLVGVGLVPLQPVLVPEVAFAEGGCRDGFGVVAYAAAAESEDEVDVVAARDADSFAQLLECGVAHHAGVFDDGLASLAEDGSDLVVDAVALDTAAAVVEHDSGSVVG